MDIGGKKLIIIVVKNVELYKDDLKNQDEGGSGDDVD